MPMPAPPNGSGDVAENFDVAARLADAHPAVSNVGDYVWACHLLGFHDPDLTLHAAQVRDWYGSEDGLDLRALAADCGALEAALVATENAMGRQDDQLAVLSGAWHGRGAEASREFLRRHNLESAAVVAAIRNAADTLATLRDDLWQTIDGKVNAAIEIDDRSAVQRDEWLAAAHTVTTGLGDRSAASELVDQQIKPFVDNDIRADWLTAMRTAMASVAASYDDAAAALAVGPPTFAIPGDLGPTWTSPPSDVPAVADPARAADRGAASVPVGSTPASSAPASSAHGVSAGPAAPVPAATPPAPPLPAPAVQPPPLEPGPAAPTAPAMTAPTAPLGGMGGGVPSLGSGLSGLGQQLADALGGLAQTPDAGLDPPDIDDPPAPGEPEELDDDAELDEAIDEATDEADDKAEDDEDDADDADLEPVPEDETAEPTAEPEPVSESAETCAEPVGEPPAPTLPAPPPPAEPIPPIPPMPPSPAVSAETPCEIAADELPQVGP